MKEATPSGALPQVPCYLTSRVSEPPALHTVPYSLLGDARADRYVLGTQGGEFSPLRMSLWAEQERCSDVKRLPCLLSGARMPSLNDSAYLVPGPQHSQAPLRLPSPFACLLHHLVEDRQGEGWEKPVSSMNISVKEAEKTGY